MKFGLKDQIWPLTLVEAVNGCQVWGHIWLKLVKFAPRAPPVALVSLRGWHTTTSSKWYKVHFMVRLATVPKQNHESSLMSHASSHYHRPQSSNIISLILILSFFLISPRIEKRWTWIFHICLVIQFIWAYLSSLYMWPFFKEVKPYLQPLMGQ